jgi:hypothetical protein
VPIFLERFVLPVLAAVVVGIVVLNPFNLDWPQRASLLGAVICLAYFVGHTVHRTSRPPSTPVTSLNAAASVFTPNISLHSEGQNSPNIVAGPHSTVNVQTGKPQRGLTNTQLVQFAQTISARPRRIGVGFIGSDDEARTFAGQLVTVFSSAKTGWAVVSQFEVQGVARPTYGISVTDSNADHVMAPFVVDALRAVGVEAEVEQGGAPPKPQPYVWVLVGHSPASKPTS